MDSRPLYVPALRRSQAWAYFLLAVVVAALYAPSVRFGLMWDDPRWYQQGVGQSLWQILTSLPTYQFYRPLAILLNRQLVSSTGVVNVPLAHAIQVGAHLIASLASVPVLRVLEFEVWHARLTALAFALCPFAYQAVAWQSPMQPLALMWVLLAVLSANAFCRRGHALFLSLSLVTYVAALLVQESALPFVFVFFWLVVLKRREASGQRWNGWPVLPLGLAGLYALVWLNVPRQGGVTGQGFQPLVLGYLLQGVAFPVASLIAGRVAAWPLAWLMSLFAATGLLLALGVWKSTSARAAALCCAWIAAGLLPIWAGLSWDYVQISSRLLYPASLGIAGLWAGWMAWAFSSQSKWRRGAGVLVLLVVLGISFRQWWQFQRLYQTGTRHLAQTVAVLAAVPEARLAFINFPDRLEIRPPLYPLGFWGLTLAPVVQNLSDYAYPTLGQSAEDRSLSSFRVGTGDREAWPYRVDMRGEDHHPAGLFDAAIWADALYLTDYVPDGALRLREVGEVHPVSTRTRVVATLGQAIQLAEAEISTFSPSLQHSAPSTGKAVTLRLVWNCRQPLRDEGATIFVHFWKEGAYWGDADGDSLGGLIPLSAWEAAWAIVDVRHIELSRFDPGNYEVRVGIYNRSHGARYPAFSADGNRLPDDEISIGTLTVPP